MKKVFLIFVMVFVAVVSSFAQGQSIGWSLNYGTKNENFGVGVKYRCYVADYFRIEPSADYFFKNRGISNWDVNCNLHFLFKTGRVLYFYPLVGASFAAFSFDSSNYNRLGLNLGGGCDWEFDRNWSLTVETKYQCLKNYGQSVFTVGLTYGF